MYSSLMSGTQPPMTNHQNRTEIVMSLFPLCYLKSPMALVVGKAISRQSKEAVVVRTSDVLNRMYHFQKSPHVTTVTFCLLMIQTSSVPWEFSFNHQKSMWSNFLLLWCALISWYMHYWIQNKTSIHNRSQAVFYDTRGTEQKTSWIPKNWFQAN
jgi:amino acid permease